MALNELDIIVDQGQDYNLAITYLNVSGGPIDITTAIISGQIVDDFEDMNRLGTFIITKTIPISGQFVATLPSTQTTNFVPKAESSINVSQRIGLCGSYDLQINQGGQVSYIIQGKVKVNRTASNS